MRRNSLILAAMAVIHSAFDRARPVVPRRVYPGFEPKPTGQKPYRTWKGALSKRARNTVNRAMRRAA